MQFGTLLIPILGGYIFIITCYWTRYIAVRDTGYHLFFKSSVAGSVLFATAYAVEPFVISSSTAIHDFWQSNLPAENIGTSALSLVLGFLTAVGFNIFCRKEKYAQSAAEKRGDRVELMLASSSDLQMQVEVTLKSSKSYIGYVVHSPFAIHGRSDVEILLTASGYRQPDTQELKLTTHYSKILNYPDNNSLPIKLSVEHEHFRIAVHMSEVISVRLFDPKLYNHLREMRQMRVKSTDERDINFPDI